MALLGAQLVITLIMVSVIQKLNPHLSFAKWLLCSTGLIRYLHPTDDELRSLAGITKEKQKGKNHYKDKGQSFHVPRSIDVELEAAKVSRLDVIHLRYYTEYAWLVDFSLYAGIVYVVSEVFHYYFPLKNEVNLSMVWCLLVVFFSFKLLASLTVLYFQNEESMGERSMCIVACLVYLLIAMMVLIVDENILETGLEQAYTSFNQSASAFLAEQGLSSTGPASKIVLKFFIALSCGLLGSLFTFPGLRMAKMHWDSLRYCKDNKILQVLLNLSFVLPFILVILWIKPISRDYLTVRVFGGMEKPLLSPYAFETARLLMVILVVVIRFSLLPVYLQAYLNIAYDRMQDLKKEAGRITNVELQQRVSSIFYYLCVVTLQFAAPLIMCLYLTLMYKSLGGFSWMGLFQESVLHEECSADVVVDKPVAIPSELGSGYEDVNIIETAQNSWKSLKDVFSEEVYKGFLGFASWWSYFTLFATSALGMVYQSYFSKS